MTPLGANGTSLAMTPEGIVIPALIAGIHLTTNAGDRGVMGPGDKPRDDSRMWARGFSSAMTPVGIAVTTDFQVLPCGSANMPPVNGSASPVVPGNVTGRARSERTASS